MRKNYILSIDQGTTGTRAVLFDEALTQVCTSYREHEQISRRPGWTEHDPEEIYRNTCLTAAETLGAARKMGISPEAVRCMGIANQGETVMAWDSVSGKPLGNAVVWHCTRSEGIAKGLRKLPGFPELVRERTGLQVDAYFSATKILWLREKLPQVRAAEAAGRIRYGTLDSWLIWKLTGGRRHVTDVTTASRTMLFNIHGLDWDGEILERLGIERRFLPEVLSNCADFGTASLAVGDSVLEIPIAGSIVDQQAALLGQFCFEKGMAKATYGTGCFVLMNAGERPVFSSHGLLTSVGWKIGETVCYVLDGAVYMAGAVMQWLRDGLQILEGYEKLDEYALSLKGNDGVYFVTAFSGLSAPVWDAAARGMLIGLTTNSTRAHVVRAALESVAYQVCELAECLREDTGIALRELKVDGGLTKSRFLNQFQADLLNLPVVLTESCEATAKGAAMLAGLGAGLYEGFSSLLTYQITDNTYIPKMSEGERERLLHDWRCAVDRARGWEER